MIFRELVAADGFGFFRAWSAADSGERHAFGRQTVVVGANGAGKTSLSSIFAAIQDVQSGNSERAGSLAGVEFVLADESGPRSATGLDPDLPRVYVFNREFIRRNLHTAFDAGSPATPLYVLGERDVELDRKIADAETDLSIRMAQSADLEGRDRRAKEGETAFLMRLKDEVSSELGTHFPNEYNRTKYNVTKVRELLGRGGCELSSCELAERREVLAQSAGSIPDNLRIVTPDDGSAVAATINRAMVMEVLSQALDRLVGDPLLARWAQSGLELHDGGDRCGFCDHVVADERLAALRGCRECSPSAS